jgi:Fe-S oxidoreductase
MARRPLSRLEPLRDTFERCLYCPKLCRAACPVSREQARETVTPWGKMVAAYLSARGDAPDDAEHAALAWACTSCFGCRERCDHRNDVASALLAVRAKAFRDGLAPESARRIAAGFGEHDAALGRAVTALCDTRGVRADAAVAVLLGCAYALRSPREARHAILAVTALTRGAVALVDCCCGLPLLLAGDADGFARAGLALARRVERFERVVVVDPGCALVLCRRYAQVGLSVEPQVETLVELADRSGEMLARLDVPWGETVRYHDACQLGRGLGQYEAPRAVLTRILGRPPDEFDYAREMAYCAGAGGLLPVVMPEVAAGIARARVREHEALGGGRIVTACGSSLAMLRAHGAPVQDLATWIARSARCWEELP